MLKDLNIVVSVYNEEEVLSQFYTTLKKELLALNLSYQIIFVNDGSTDDSVEILRQISDDDQFVTVINFSRNFGHEEAMMAGLDHANAKAVICMDADLQHPPSLIKEMWLKFQEGKDIITMVRMVREDESWVKGVMNYFFYCFINAISEFRIEPNASDFFLISNRVVKVINENYREKTRFLRGIIQMVGFDKETLKYAAPKRIGGCSKYGFFDLLSLSLNAIVSMTKTPLKIGIYMGVVNALISLGLGGYTLVMYFLDKPFAGYTTIILLLTVMFSVLFFVLGILGNYVGHIFEQTKNRPHYIVMDIHNDTSFVTNPLNEL